MAATEELSEKETVSSATVAEKASEETNEDEPIATAAETVVVGAGLKSNVVIVEPEDEILNDIENQKKKVEPRPGEICGILSVIPVRNINANDDYLRKGIIEKVEAKKVKIEEIFIQRTSQGTFIRCDVMIEPLRGEILKTIDFEFENCSVVPFYGIQ